MKNFNFSLSLIILSIILLSNLNNSFGQSVAINGNGNPADPQAILDVSSDTKGVLLPRVADHTTITPSSGSDDGLVVYDTGSDSYWYWDGSSWQEIPNANDIPSVSLDDAYNAGRIIIADAGAVEINNVGGLLVNGNVGIGTTAQSNRLVINGSNIDSQSVLSLRSGNNNNGFNDGGQIAFGYNGTDDYQHFIQSRHNAGTIQENSLDFYVSDGTQNNSITVGSLHVMSLNGGNVGIGDTSPDAKLDVDAVSGNLLILAQSGTERMRVDASGNAWITGKFNSNGIEELSDARYKKNIEKLNGALENVLKIQGVTYNWRQDEFPERSFGSQTEIGFIAQELEKIYPELVNTNEDGYKSVQYSHMVPVLLEAIKEQQHLINMLMSNIEDFDRDLKASNELKNDASGKIIKLTTQLEDISERLDRAERSSTITSKKLIGANNIHLLSR
jgi:hypothetical protein